MKKMNPKSFVTVVGVFLIVGIALTASADTVQLSRAALLDKIRGGWVGKAYGVAFGGPTEFKHMGTIIEGPLEMQDSGLERIANQDDLFVNMAFLQMVAEHGFDTPAQVFAEAFAYAGFGLGHANSQARQNILAGVPADMSGHPRYSPHAEDIDFQIEADFIGLIYPGLPQAAWDMCDRVGHIMNYGDGFYGGVFAAAMYEAAFVQDDPHEIVASALNALPQDSGYAAVIQDTMRWYKAEPKDWRATWHKLQEKWGHEDRCPWGVTGAHGSLKGMFNISARLNGAYIVLGMLYGEGDFDKTVEISTRAGQDSDCNPSTAAGVLGTMMGYKSLPEHVKKALEPYMNVKFSHTIYTIETASQACLELGIANVKAHGGKEHDGTVYIDVQPFKAPPGPTEVAFANLIPSDGFWVTDNRITWEGDWKEAKGKDKDGLRISGNAGDYMEVKFPGTAVYVESAVRKNGGILEVTVDGKPMGTRDMYLKSKDGKRPGWNGQVSAVWLTGLPDSAHTLRVTVTGEKNPDSEGTEVGLGRIACYRGRVGAFAAIAHGENSDEGQSPLVGTWKLTSNWMKKDSEGMQVMTVNADHTGTVKDVENGWETKLRNVELKSDALSFSFYFEDIKDYEADFKGTIVDKKIKGELAVFGAKAAVEGVPLSVEEAAKIAAQRSIYDIYEARSFTGSKKITLPYRLFVPENYDPKKKYPLVLFHHGGGGTGEDNRRNLEGECIREWILPKVQADNPCFIVAPQFPGKESKSVQDGTFSMEEHTQTIHEILDSLEKEFSIDTSREYVTGLSFGGGCTWISIVERPDRFAAGVPICATDAYAELTASNRTEAVAKVPLWIFHGDADDAVPVETSRKMVKAIKDAGGNPRYTEYPGVDHNSWNLAYRDPELIEWLFAQKRLSDSPGASGTGYKLGVDSGMLNQCSESYTVGGSNPLPAC